MKKRLTLLLSLILAVIMGLSVSACNLVTVNKQADMAQIVATVALADDVSEGNLKNIKKSDLSMAYMNYGYYYIYQGYDKDTVIEYLLKQLLTTRMLVQNVILEYYGTDKDLDPTKDKWDVERYLTKENKTVSDKLVLSEYNEALYSTYKSINNLIDSYEEAEDEKYSDTSSLTARTVPTDAANDTEVSAEKKQEYIDKGIDVGATDAKRRKAFNKVLKFFENNEMLGDGYVTGDIKTTDYYKSMLNDNEKAQLLKKYEEEKKAEFRATVTYQALKDAYAEMYNAQVSGYSTSITDFNSAISDASASKPLVYSPYSGYGYVYNLLLGVNNLQKTEINAITETDKTERATIRRDILASTTAKDLRASWILSGYDLDYDEETKTVTFKGDYTLCKDAPLSFSGEVTRFTESEEDETYSYRIDSVKEYTMDEFIELIENYVYGGEQEGEGTENPSIYRKADIDAGVENYDQKISELLFAFSTDPGSLNTYKGYSITPAPDFNGAETYMQEFADAGRELLEMGGNSYIIVATDYGYHVMFFSEVINADLNYATLEDYLDSLREPLTTWEAYYNDMLENWEDFEDTDFYLYTLMKAQSDKLVSDGLSEFENNIYESNKSKIVKYADRYSDLLD